MLITLYALLTYIRCSHTLNVWIRDDNMTLSDRARNMPENRNFHGATLPNSVSKTSHTSYGDATM